MSVSARRVPYFITAVLLLAATVTLALFTTTTYAAGDITGRSLTLEDGSTGDGGSKPSGVVKHLFTFTLPSSAAVQSIVFQYCTTADIDVAGGTCTTPAGLSTTGAGVTLGTVNGDATNFTSFTNTTNGAPYIDTASAVTPVGSTPSTVELDGVTNPDGTDCTTTPNSCTFYVNIQAWSGTGGTGTLESHGTVAASVNAQIVLTGTMPESLIFCTGGTISMNTNSTPDCTTATSGAVKFPMLFSPTSTAYTTSQMAASTNANSGYAITVSGTTLVSGSNSITALSTAGASSTGTGQFGINLVKNADFCGAGCDLGADVTTTGGSLYNGEALAGYNTAGTFQFKPSTVPGSPVLNDVADSLTGNGTPPTGASDAQTYTVSYMVNVPGHQPPGSYATTLTYICTPTF